MHIEPINQISPAKEAFRQLATLIESGHLKAFSLLPSERHLAEMLGVSRGLVREVTKKLEQQGLVSIRQGIGIQVINNPSLSLQRTLSDLVPKSMELLRQCAQARMLIEPELAACAAARSTPRAVRRLMLLHHALMKELKFEKAAEKDIEFHDAIAEMAGSRVLGLMLRSVAELGSLSRQHTLRKFGRQRAYDYHGKILAAISAGNPAQARQAMKNHLSAALGDLT